MNDATLILGAIAAMIASGAIGSIETALSGISRARVEELHREEKPGAAQLLTVIDRRADHINLLVLLRTALEATAAVFVALLAVTFITDRKLAATVAVAAITFVSYAVVGVLSRTIGRKNPYTVSLNSAQVLSVLAFLLGPISKILIFVGNTLAPGEGLKAGPFASEVELREMVDIAQEHGVVEVGERRMIQSVFDLGTTTARSVMVPRPEMVWIESVATAGDATRLCVRSGLSRLPVIGETVDDIVGVVYLKDLVQKTYSSTDSGSSVQVTDVMRPAYFVPDSKNLDDLLREMQVKRCHLAMLVDEYGGIAGLLSIEDILEEIVGEIADEYDSAERAPVEHLGQRSYRVLARLSLEDLHDLIVEEYGVDLVFDDEVENEVETVAGLISYEEGRVPLPGSTVSIAGLTLTAEGGKDRRGRNKIATVKVDVEDALFDTPAEV
ncbi:hemolysin family protein [Corynebacterium choanae]|uniref:Magnesium and cobalt efflux protein CorC n=1 Tax=Corynebacterium choanae TaxID=1862358 RepID=A0A3G6J7G4_9CORY|nr:hemolysin family protein [Corynebacterium choanae]AZA14061.1 Magnesium and cobalt efflux protein CorC [Corynebacterium choanae]